MLFFSFLEIPNHTSLGMVLFHRLLSDWLFCHSHLFIAHWDHVTVVPSSRNMWSYQFRSEKKEEGHKDDQNDSSWFMTLLPPYWELEVHYSDLPSSYESCPLALLHHWHDRLRTLHAHLQSLHATRKRSDPLLIPWTRLLLQWIRELDPQVQGCPHCRCHRHHRSLLLSSVRDPTTFPTQWIPPRLSSTLPSSIFDPCLLALSALDAHWKTYLRSPLQRKQLYLHLSTLAISHWEAWLQCETPHEQNTLDSFQNQAVRAIETQWLKEAPFLPLLPSATCLRPLVHFLFQTLTEIEDWESVGRSQLMHSLSQSTFLLVLLFPELFSRGKQYFRHEKEEKELFEWTVVIDDDDSSTRRSPMTEISSSSSSSSPTVAATARRFFDTHPLLLAHFIIVPETTIRPLSIVHENKKKGERKKEKNGSCHSKKS